MELRQVIEQAGYCIGPTDMFTITTYGACVCLHGAESYLHKTGFAGTITAQQACNTAGIATYIYIAKNGAVAELQLYAIYFKGMVHRRAAISMHRVNIRKSARKHASHRRAAGK